MGGDVSRPTGKAAERLLAGGLWIDLAASDVQSVADDCGMVEPNAEESIANQRLAADAWDTAAVGDIFRPAGRGMSDLGVYMGTSAGYMTDRSGLIQKVAVEAQSAQVDISKIVASAEPEIQKAWDQGDELGADRLIAQYRSAIQGRMDSAVSTMSAAEAQHEASVPEPQYVDSTNATVATPGRQVDRTGAVTNSAAPSSLASYSSRASSTSPMQSGAPVSTAGGPNQGLANANTAATESGAPSGLSAPQTPNAPAPAGAGGGAGAPAARPAAAGQGAATQLMSGSPAAAAVGDFKPSTSGGFGGPVGGPSALSPGGLPVGAVAAPSSPAPPAPGRVAAPPPSVPTPPANTASGSTSAAGSQQPALSGGGGSGARQALGPTNAQSAAKAMLSADAATRPEAAGTVVAKTGREKLLENGVLVPDDDPYLAELRTAVRTLALQIMLKDSVHLLTDLRVAGFYGVGGSTSAPRLVLVTGCVGGLDFVPAKVRVDRGAQHVRDKTYGAAAKQARKWWRWLVDDPLWNLVAVAEEIASRPGEEGFKVTHIVTTRAGTPHPDLVERMAALGASFLSDPIDRPEDAGKAGEVDIPSSLRHRVHQISPAWAAAEGVELPKDRARAFAVALAKETLALAPGIGAESPLHQMVERVRTALPVDEKLRTDVHKVRDDQSLQLVGMFMGEPPPPEEPEAVAATINWGTTVIAGKEAEAPPPPPVERADPDMAKVSHWWRSRAAQLVLLLDDLDEPGANLASVCLDLAYEAVHATEDPGLVERLMREYGLLEPASAAA